MDEKWVAYEQKQKDLKKQFKGQYLKVLAIFAAYNIVADTIIFFIKDIISSPMAIVTLLVSTGLSFYITLKAIADLRKIKHEQLMKLQQEAPVGKIRI